MRRRWLILGWVATTAGIAGHLGHAFVSGERQLFLPGETSHGHHQIELLCESCHTPGRGVDDEPCLRCHAAELDAKADSHPAKRFRDPRNAILLDNLDARRCITCHGEHRPDDTTAMGVTQPVTFCQHCHADVGELRPTHEGLPFSSCQDAGCHNYHDNRSTNADYLTEHALEFDYLTPARLPSRRHPPGPNSSSDRLRIADLEVLPSSAATGEVMAAWEASAHARGGVSCTDCHGEGAAWRDAPGEAACTSCHEREADGFSRGRHGMRIAAGLSPMTPGEARLPMNPSARDHELGCTSCHGAHDADTRRAAVDACLSCHRDEHSLAYRDSPHYELWRAEIAGYGEEGTGVSCASCHLPRTDDHGDTAAVDHNQSNTLRPRDAMVGTVCRHCHGAAFSLSALADDDLVRENFRRAPAERVRTFQFLEEAAK